MKVLIAESNPELGAIWARHLVRQGTEVTLRMTSADAIMALSEAAFDLIVLNLSLGEAEALSVADYAAYRHPESKIIFVTGSTFFTDGSIFSVCPNACACLPEHTPPQDLAALVEYHLGNVA